jgi:hypothetical protein
MNKTQLKYLKNQIIEKELRKKQKNQENIILVGTQLTKEQRVYCKRAARRLTLPINPYLNIKGAKYLYFGPFLVKELQELPIFRIFIKNILFDKQRLNFCFIENKVENLSYIIMENILNLLFIFNAKRFNAI